MRKSELQMQVSSDLDWHKSTKSGPYSDNCVEVAKLTGGFAVRDSQTPGSPVLVFDDEEWDAFLAGAAAGEFSRS